MKNVTTPEQFEAELRELLDKGIEIYDGVFDPDPEVRHMIMDDVLCRVLTELGYGAGVAVFRQTPKWYA